MALSPQKIRLLAERLRKAEETGVAIDPIRDQLPVGDLASAYAIQKVNTQHWLRKGRRLIGRKIGLTSKSVQKQLGVDQPDYGMLYADMNVPEGMDIPIDRVMQPKVEAEIAFVMGHDLDVIASARGQHSASLLFTPTTPGVYTFYCAAPGHKEAGQTGVLIVK